MHSKSCRATEQSFTRISQPVLWGAVHPRIPFTFRLQLPKTRLRHWIFDDTRIASLIPCKNFLSAGTIVASAPRNFTRSLSTK
jgi:hypothetical protein